MIILRVFTRTGYSNISYIFVVPPEYSISPSFPHIVIEWLLCDRLVRNRQRYLDSLAGRPLGQRNQYQTIEFKSAGSFSPRSFDLNSHSDMLGLHTKGRVAQDQGMELVIRIRIETLPILLENRCLYPPRLMDNQSHCNRDSTLRRIPSHSNDQLEAWH